MATVLSKKIRALSKADPGALTKVQNDITLVDLQDFDAKVVKSFKRIFVDFRDIPKDVYNITIGVLGYEGFDPENIYKSFMFTAKKLGVSLDEMNADIIALIILHHIRGNINSKNMNSFKPEAKNLINDLLTRWKIQSDLKTGIKATTITLPRIGAAFPLQCSIVAGYHKRDFTGIFDSFELPDCIKTSSFSSLVPSGGHLTWAYVSAHNQFACDMNVVISGKDFAKMTDDEKKALFASQYKFTHISFRSPVMGTRERKFAMCKLGLNKLDVAKAIVDIFKKHNLMNLHVPTDDEIQKEIDDWTKEQKADLDFKGQAAKNRQEVIDAIGGNSAGPTDSGSV